MRTTLATHGAYLSWAADAVRRANLAWRGRKPYAGESVMSRQGLHHHLFRWAIASGRIKDPGPCRARPYSVYVAGVFEDDPDAVKQAARSYWKLLVDQHAQV
jgi:hypothetical protein